ncbi:MAG TPA: Hpt domain-containing protein [Acidobacteriaceae bacterium]|nr:Hpt domain-containing protein [Acidobacteriaceae bacterium]
MTAGTGTSDAAAKIAARLTELWQTSRPTILERMTALHAACDALARHPADTGARASGREAAHKLSGVLGVFGLPQGSELASAIEFQLESDQPLNAEDLAALRRNLAALDAVIASKDTA